MNKIFKIGIFGGLTLGAAWLFKLKTMSDKLVSNLSNPRIYKIDASGVIFRTEIKLQNPTKHSMNITKPVVSLSTNGTYIAGNNPEQKTITVKPLSITMIDTIEIVLSWTVLSSYISGIILKVPQMIAAYKANNKKEIVKLLAIPLEVKYSLYADGLFFESDPQKIM